MKTMIGMILLALGLTTSITSAVNAVTSMTGFADSMQRITNEGTVTFDEAGRYMMFYEQRTLIDGKPYLSRGGQLGFTLRELATDEVVPVPNVAGDYRYNFGAREGLAIGAFTITEPGDYSLSADHDDGSPVVLAVARPLGASIAKTFVFGFLAFLGFALLATGLVVFLTALSATPRQRGSLIFPLPTT